MHKTLWVLQWLLGILFVFAGVGKLAMPLEPVAQQAGLSVGFLQFVSVCEILGGLGLILPGLLRIRAGLTPLAAAGLAIIMIGATVTSVKTGPLALALFPCVVGILVVFVGYGRWRLAPVSSAG